MEPAQDQDDRAYQNGNQKDLHRCAPLLNSRDEALKPRASDIPKPIHLAAMSAVMIEMMDTILFLDQLLGEPPPEVA